MVVVVCCVRTGFHLLTPEASGIATVWVLTACRSARWRLTGLATPMTRESVRCPKCKDDDTVRRSHRRRVDLPLRLFGLRPYRCLVCNKRFYAWPADRPPGGEKVH